MALTIARLVLIFKGGAFQYGKAWEQIVYLSKDSYKYMIKLHVREIH
jgi:hypothetical protein